MRLQPSGVPVAGALAALSLVLAGCGPNLIERLSNFWSLSCCGVVIVVLDLIALLELAGSTRPTREKVLWALIVVFFPLLGCILYYFIGRKRA
jgi:hypothetical protein